jgi:hypothetical protein
MPGPVHHGDAPLGYDRLIKGGSMTAGSTLAMRRAKAKR